MKPLRLFSQSVMRRPQHFLPEVTFPRRRPKSGSDAKFGSESTSSLCTYGFSHRSKLERAVCDLIAWQEKAGEMKHLAHEVRVHLSDARIGYVADFRCELPDGSEVYIEAKGFEKEKWSIIRRLWLAYGPGPLQIYKGSHLRPVLTETLLPTRLV